MKTLSTHDGIRISGCGRVTLRKLDDPHTPHLFYLKHEGEYFTATPGCVEGEGAIEDIPLTDAELKYAFAASARLEGEEL